MPIHAYGEALQFDALDKTLLKIVENSKTGSNSATSSKIAFYNFVYDGKKF